MRMHRIVIAVLAFCLVGLVPFTGASSATASEPAAKAAGASVETQAAKPARKVAFKFKELRRGYKFTGKVQDGKRAKIILERSDSKKGKYRPYKTGRTNASGSYSFGPLSKAGWYYIKVPGNKKYATSYSQLIHVYYI